MTKLAVISFFSMIFCQSLLMASNLDEVSVYTEEYPPYNFRDNNGELQGIAVDLIVNAYKHANVNFDKDKINLRPWSKTYRDVQEISNTMLFSMTRTKEREALFKWAGPISKTKVVLLAKKSNKISINSVEDLSKYKIGGIRNDIGLSLTTGLVVNRGQLKTFSSATAIAKVLNLGRIDLWAYEQNVAMHFLKGLNLDFDDFEPVYTLSESELYYAFNINTEQKIVDDFQAVLDNFKRANKTTP